MQSSCWVPETGHALQKILVCLMLGHLQPGGFDAEGKPGAATTGTFACRWAGDSTQGSVGEVIDPRDLGCFDSGLFVFGCFDRTSCRAETQPQGAAGGVLAPRELGCFDSGLFVFR